MSVICLKCGNEMIWNSDASYEDLLLEGDGVVSFYSCPDCDSSLEFYYNENSEVEK